MKEENRKRINNLIIPFTKKLYLFLAAATMLVTGTVGCKDNNNKDKDTSSLTGSQSNNDVTYSNEESTIEDNVESSTNEESNIEQNDNKINNNSSNNKVNSTNSKNNQTNNSSSNKTNNSNNNQSSSNNTSTPSTPVETPSIPTTPSTPAMPSTLTAENINDVEVFKHFAENIYINLEADITNIGYWYNNQIYYANIDEHNFLVFLLNSRYIDVNTYSKLFGDKSKDDLNRMSNFVSGILNYAGKAELNINYDKIVIDANMKEFLRLLQSEMKNGNLKQFVIDFFNGNQKYYNYQDNYLMDYFVNMAGYNLLSDEDINSVNLLNYYFDINRQKDLYINNLYREYNGKQYQK